MDIAIIVGVIYLLFIWYNFNILFNSRVNTYYDERTRQHLARIEFDNTFYMVMFLLIYVVFAPLGSVILSIKKLFRMI